MIKEQLYQTYLQELLAGNKANCNAIVNQLQTDDADFRSIYLDLFQRSLYEVGQLWENNTISVATEHIATAITESLLALLYPSLFLMDHNGRKAVVTCAMNEYHQIGGKMIADIFEVNGWDSHFLGANTPVPSLLEHIESYQPDVVALSLSLYGNMERLVATLHTIRGNFANLDLIVGGQAFFWGGREKLKEVKGTDYFADITSFEKALPKN